MLIQNLTNIYNKQNISAQKIAQKAVNFRALNVSQPIADSFKRRNFEPDDLSFEAFRNWADKTDFYSKAKEIVEVSGRILGSGFEGTTYEIPDCENWVIKSYKRSDFIRKPLEHPTLTKIDDISPDLNIGQNIGIIEIPAGKSFSYRYYILKRQTGDTYGVKKVVCKNYSQENIASHLNTLKKVSELPAATFEKCVKDAAYITSQGYEIDYENPANLMLDNSKQEIHFVDINDKLNGEGNQYSKVLFSLMDGFFGLNFNEEVEDIETVKKSNNLSKEVSEKYFNAMKKSNVKFCNDKALQQLIESKSFYIETSDETPEEKITLLKAKGLLE